MIKKFKGFKIFFILAVLVLGFSFIPVRAQTNNYKDSDYDGLTDQAEKNIYRTNPLSGDTDSDGFLDVTEVLSGSDPLNSSDPAASVATTTALTQSLPWLVTRAAALVAYLLLFLVIILGTGMTSGYVYKYLSPVQAWIIHKYLSLALGVTLITHISALLFDKFINFGWSDILIPFASSFKPLFLSLGIAGFYLLLIIIFTSLFFRIKYQRTWRGIHYCTYPLFIFSFVHGVFLGSDTHTLAMQIIYWSTGLIFWSLLIYRFLFYGLRPRSK